MKPSGPKGVDWKVLRAEHALGVSVKQLSLKHGLSERAIYQQRQRDTKRGDPWEKASTGRSVSKAPPGAPALSVLPGGKDADAGEKRRSRQPAPPPRDVDDEDVELEDLPAGGVTIEHVLAEHTKLVWQMMRAANRKVRKLESIEPGMNQSEADVFKNVMAGSKIVLEMGREIAGKRNGEASSDGDVDRSETIIVRRVIERPAKTA